MNFHTFLDMKINLYKIINVKKWEFLENHLKIAEVILKIIFFDTFFRKIS